MKSFEEQKSESYDEETGGRRFFFKRNLKFNGIVKTLAQYKISSISLFLYLGGKTTSEVRITGSLETHFNTECEDQIALPVYGQVHARRRLCSLSISLIIS